MKKIRYLSLLMLLLSSIALWARPHTAPDHPSLRLADGETLLTVVADPPEGGSVSGGGSYVAGKSVSLRASANNGFQFVNWMLNGEVVSTTAAFTYTKGDADETLVAHFVYNPGNPGEPAEPVKLSRLTLVADPVDGGSVSGGGDFAKDTQVSVIATASTGFQFVNWTRDGEEISVERNFTYTKGDADEILVAHFIYQPGNPGEPSEPDIKPIDKKYKLTVVAEEGGTNVSGSGEYVSGTQVTLSVSISTGFSLLGWYNDADSLLSTNTRFTYTTQERDETITARIKYSPGNPGEPDEPNLPNKPKPHKITVMAVPADGGSVSVGSETVMEGEQTRIRAVANTGFVFQGWYVADTLFQSAADFNYTMGTKDINMEARFIYSPGSPNEPGEATKKSYTLYLTSVRGLPGRTVQYPIYLSSQDSLTNIQFNITFPVGLTPNLENVKLSGKVQGYTLHSEEIAVTSDESQGSPRRAADRETAYQFTLTDGKLPACNTRLMTIDVAISEDVTDTTQQVKINQVTVTDTEGNNTTASTRNGAVVMQESSGDGTYYYLTLITTGSGQATVNSRTVRNSLHVFDLLEGSSTNVYFVPDNGYHVDKVMLDEQDITEQVRVNSRYLLSDVRTDATITVMFAEGASSAYNLTVKSQGAGVVNFNGQDVRNGEQVFTVSHGAQAEISITPDAGYHIGQVLLNDTIDVTSRVVEGLFVIQSMTSANSISVSFEQNPKVPSVEVTQDGYMVSLSNSMSDAVIHYTLSNSQAGEQVYTDSLTLTADCTISAWATREGYNNSDTIQFVFVAADVTVATPQITNVGNVVKITTATEQATIYYTLDGTEPTANSTVYADSIIVDHNCMLKAIALRQNWFTSDVATFEVDWIVTGTATFDGLVATVSGDKTLDDAFEAAGGRSEAAKTIAAIRWNKETAMTESDLQGLNNPNLLVYVSAEALAPAGVQNVVINGVAKSIVLTDTKEGNGNFCVPQQFTAESISYTRNFQQTTQIGVCRGWETIALPFDVQSIKHESKGDIVPFGSTENGTHFWLRRLMPDGLQSAQRIEANMPYVISMPNSEEYTYEFILAGRVTFSAQNATVPVTAAKVTALADSSITMEPTMVAVGRSSTVWALNVGQVRGSNVEGSVFERDYREVRPFEAYTVHRQGNSSSGEDNPAPRMIPIQKLMDSDATGIEDVRWQMSDGRDDHWYDLNGRKLQCKPTKKGVYIWNGHKRVVR